MPIEVILPGNISDSFHYSVPKQFQSAATLGKRVLVPLGNRRTIGFVIGSSEPPEGIYLRDIIDVIDDGPLFDETRLEFFKWIADYYICPLGAVAKAAHPSGLGSMSVRRKIAITEAGKTALKKSKLSGNDKTILRALESGEMTLEKLFEVVEDSSFGKVHRLENKGLAEIEYEVKRGANIRYETLYSAAAGSSARSEISKMPAKRSVVELIEEHGKISRPDIKDILGNTCAPHLKWLEEKGIIEAEKIEIVRDPFAEIKPDGKPAPKMTAEQQKAFSEIKKAVHAGKFKTFLLHGVTGSGKTEVYLRTIKEVVRGGAQALVMVPEISLTPQLVQRFKSRFGDGVCVMHSGLSEGERFDSWRRIKSGAAQIVIGARSAIFAPFPNLGLIVVDEEHERSYKQENKNPCYNARDCAVVLGRMTDCPVILGSATPSVETYRNAVAGRFEYLSMPLRIEGSLLPRVEIVKQEKTVFSAPLKKALLENLENGGKTILFLNRRGFSTALICDGCGETLCCPNCSISLTYHKKGNTVKCHYCGIDEKFENACPGCGGEFIRVGMGTQTIEDEVRKIMPSATVARMDSDEVSGKTKLLELYGKLEKGSIDVLVGTQMVAKGHDLPEVTLVGVISADMSLSIPDFRSGEVTFQTLTQVAGRAGRGKSPGRALIQTAKQNHPSIKYAVGQDAVAFLESELEVRKITGWPPFSRVVALKFSGTVEKNVELIAERVHSLAVETSGNLKSGEVEIVGYSECPIYRIKNRFRWHIIMRSESPSLLGNFSRALKEEAERIMPPKTRVIADIDPVSFL
ncbi:replication restart helicase PriA [Candidatus Mycalebacterium sp.]